MADGPKDLEEHFVLRIKDDLLAEKLRCILREQLNLNGFAELSFQDNNQDGTLTVEGKAYPVKLLNIPTLVEAYKTYDDVNLVKINDVGQILLVGSPGSELPVGPEIADGVTPPCRNARQRHFKPLPKVDPSVVSRVERDLLALLSGYAPAGMEITDVEEEYTIDDETKEGSWQPVAKR